MCFGLLVTCLILGCVSHVYTGNCHGPKMKLFSDDPRRTCTEISASNDRIEYKCTSLIRDVPKAMIKYCPVEVCQENDTWSKPSISCALSECYVTGRSNMYVGHRTCTASGRPCQRWDAQEPHRHRFQKSNMFPDQTIALADAFCRDPEGNKGAPWCFTSDPEKKWELCDVPDCSGLARHDNFCGTVPTESDDEDDILPADDTTSVDGGTCSDAFEYQLRKDHRIKSKVVDERTTRSVIECTSLCSQMTSCRAITFRHEDNMCTLHGGKDTMYIKSRGYQSGVKTCTL